MITANDIHETRDRLGWTQQQLAAELGVSLRTVQYWEKGDRQPPAYLKNALTSIERAVSHGHGRVHARRV